MDRNLSKDSEKNILKKRFPNFVDTIMDTSYDMLIFPDNLASSYEQPTVIILFFFHIIFFPSIFNIFLELVKFYFVSFTRATGVILVNCCFLLLSIFCLFHFRRLYPKLTLLLMCLLLLVLIVFVVVFWVRYHSRISLIDVPCIWDLLTQCNWIENGHFCYFPMFLSIRVIIPCVFVWFFGFWF